ncbi:hypothetical protein BU15DRAFT_57588 [Melanogaster broomeanus]|nr:hypothetical protein BU15DRAFT_57588 [Melanogaster broomeanus]
MPSLHPSISVQPSSSSRRPSTTRELADRALDGLWDPTKGLKHWLRAAEGFRKAGRAYHETGELEAAFVEFAKVATITLERLPTHKEYYTLLTPTQRRNLGLVSNSSPTCAQPLFAIGMIDRFLCKMPLGFLL